MEMIDTIDWSSRTICTCRRAFKAGNTTFVRQRHLSDNDICPTSGTKNLRHLSDNDICPTSGTKNLHQKFATFVRQRHLSDSDFCPNQILLFI